MLSAYALACGYVETLDGLSLYREHHVYHVRGFRRNVRVWQVFRTLKEARAVLRAL